MKKTLITLLLALFIFAPGFAPKAEAIDPVTIAILTPIAIKGAQIAAPYVIRGLMSGGAHMLEMGVEIINIFRLPLGILQCTIGLPFQQLHGGVSNLARGAVAPFKLAWKALILPIAFMKIGGG